MKGGVGRDWVGAMFTPPSFPLPLTSDGCRQSAATPKDCVLFKIFILGVCVCDSRVCLSGLFQIAVKSQAAGFIQLNTNGSPEVDLLLLLLLKLKTRIHITILLLSYLSSHFFLFVFYNNTLHNHRLVNGGCCTNHRFLSL